MNCCDVWIVVVSVIGAFLIVIGALLGFSILPDYVHDEIAKQVHLKGCTDQFERWEELPFAMTFKVYLFEVTNPDEVMNGKKPIVKERGPYVYDQWRKKVDIERARVKDTLTYRQIQNYEFNKGLSVGNEDDEFYVLNTPLIGALQTMDNFGMAGMFDGSWEGAFKEHNTTGPFIKIKIREYLFEGLVFCTDTKNFMCSTMVDTVPLIKTLEVTDKGAISFAFFRFKDNADDGVYTVGAGIKNVEDLGLIRSWNGKNESDVWEKDSVCNEIKGRDSSVYPPYIEKEDTFDIFSTDICRVVTLEYVDEAEYQGITGQRRQLKKDTLTNTGKNSCYCIYMIANLDGTKVDCLPDGFIDLYNCMTASVVLSFPHFLWADKDVAATVDGLKADESNHVTFVVLEPDTGYPLQGAKRVQFNMVLRPIKGITLSQTWAKAMMPLVWVEEGVNLPEDLVDELKDKYLNKLVMIDAITWTLIAVGIVLFIGFGVWFIFRVKNKNDKIA